MSVSDKIFDELMVHRPNESPKRKAHIEGFNMAIMLAKNMAENFEKQLAIKLEEAADTTDYHNTVLWRGIATTCYDKDKVQDIIARLKREEEQ